MSILKFNNKWRDAELIVIGVSGTIIIHKFVEFIVFIIERN